VTREWPADWQPEKPKPKLPTWLYLVAVAMVAIVAAMPELGRFLNEHPVPAYLGLFGLFLVLAGLFPQGSFKLPKLFQRRPSPIDRRERDRRLAEVARSRIPLIARHTALQLDDELDRAITALAEGDRPEWVAGRLDQTTDGGRNLARRARPFCAMAIGMLGDLPEDELERAMELREAESCLWAARAEHLRGVCG